MSRFTRRQVLHATMALAATLNTAPSSPAQTVRELATVLSVRKMLERLPYYGVFDFLAFSVDHGTVTLVGHAYHSPLRADAERAARRSTGVNEVANKIELLPVSANDDRIRWATFYNIYSDSFLSRYAPGGASEAYRELLDAAKFPGMQPVGRYPIHIVVSRGHTMLFGVVDSAGDRQMAEFRAREVSGVFSVENHLAVAQ